MYKQVETYKTATLDNGVEFTPVATLADEWGGRCQIAKEAFDALVTLPEPK